MLVMTRKNQESIVVGNSAPFVGTLKVTVVAIDGGTVKLAFEVDGDGRGKDPLADVPGTCRLAVASCGCLVVDESPERIARGPRVRALTTSGG